MSLLSTLWLKCRIHWMLKLMGRLVNHYRAGTYSKLDVEELSFWLLAPPLDGTNRSV